MRSPELPETQFRDGGLVSNTPLLWVLDSRPGWTRGLPDRSVERARRAAAQSRRSRRAAEGNPVLQSRAGGDGSVQASFTASASMSVYLLPVQRCDATQALHLLGFQFAKSHMV